MYLKQQTHELALSLVVASIANALQQQPYLDKIFVTVDDIELENEEGNGVAFIIQDWLDDPKEEEEYTPDTPRRGVYVIANGGEEGTGGDDYESWQSHFYLVFERYPDPSSANKDKRVAKVWYTHGSTSNSAEFGPKQREWDEQKLTLVNDAIIGFLINDADPAADLEAQLDAIQLGQMD